MKAILIVMMTLMVCACSDDEHAAKKAEPGGDFVVRVTISNQLDAKSKKILLESDSLRLGIESLLIGETGSAISLIQTAGDEETQSFVGSFSDPTQKKKVKLRRLRHSAHATNGEVALDELKEDGVERFRKGEDSPSRPNGYVGPFLYWPKRDRVGREFSSEDPKAELTSKYGKFEAIDAQEYVAKFRDRRVSHQEEYGEESPRLSELEPFWTVGVVSGNGIDAGVNGLDSIQIRNFDNVEFLPGPQISTVVNVRLFLSDDASARMLQWTSTHLKEQMVLIRDGQLLVWGRVHAPLPSNGYVDVSCGIRGTCITTVFSTLFASGLLTVEVENL